MKKGIVTIKLTLVAGALMMSAAPAYGRFAQSAPAPSGNGGNNGAASSTQSVTWSWTQVKEAVEEKLGSWFHYGKSDSSAQTVVNTAPAPVPANPVKPTTAQTDSWNPFKTWLSDKPKTAAAKIDEKPSISPEMNMKNSAAHVRDIKVARTAQPAVVFHDKNLILGHNGVPVFEFKKFRALNIVAKRKRIPLLDVGQEEILDANSFQVVNIILFPDVPYEAPQVLQTPGVATIGEFNVMLGGPVAMVNPPEKIEVPVLQPEQKVTAEKIAKLVYSIAPDSPVTPLPVTVIAEEDLKLLRGLILFEKKDQCHVASGIFGDLLNSPRTDLAESAQYHLGVCLHEMNLPTEALYHLGKVLHGKTEKFIGDAIKTALEDLQVQHENEVVEELQGVPEKLFPEGSVAQIDYLKSKYDLRKGHPEKALDYATKVPTSSPFYFKAQYLASVAEYEMGKEDASINRQKTVSADLAKKGSDKDILALFEMNLGRVAFQKGKYKDSIEAYQKIPRESPLWMEGLMELGWVQLQYKDLAGAIGNMHSIQSPYFDGVFKPESYVVRSIGYVNLCQFPDAYKSVGYLDYKYSPWLAKLQEYNKNHGATESYMTVLKMLQTKGNVDVDGLPYQVIKEAARQRDFLNAQEALNQLVDESTGYSFVRSLIEKDKRSLLLRRNATINKVAELNNKIKKARSTPGAMKNFNEWRFELANNEDFLSVYEFKVKTMKEGEDGLMRIAPKAQERIATRRTGFKEDAGHILRNHFVKVAKELSLQLENNELLKYEVYAGSGENLRYQMAGGKTGGPKGLAERKPAGMKWDFDGEYWADEIGNYRSSLKNNCQNVQVAGQRKGN